ncbi:TonB-linked SusC/RagA family outer membrane protein [Mucilaginibacter auburnensis]|uniref:TonB-linked SusC/RagA family outer membrane protein n=1 Tax=Mucilaginibacter auburnensis TaxID=1457233 RepID=A0A2H9VNX0_9SPHI|nr:TonB-linked SusC/RagA family outer membrane protein [Mucilaginibacter auburnensis]
MTFFTHEKIRCALKMHRRNFSFKAVLLIIAITIINYTGAYSQNASATLRVSGLVTDLSTGETLIGATVKVKGTSTAVAVDAAGKFTIEVPSAQSVLVANFIGYTDLEVPVQGKTVLDIKLSKVTTNLDEVVVTGFGLTTKKATLAGAISTVTADELSHSRAATASGALVGRVPGVNFRQDNGRPGSAPTIQIRNYGTPLIVIDGVTRDYTSFSNMDFNDIESISVLKDGSAAIYGMLASNGVVVITTKKGKRNQKPTVGFQSYYGIQKVANYNKPADAKTFIRALVQDETYNNRTRTITRAEYDKWMAGTEPGYQGFDWYDFIWGKAAPQIYNSFNFSGGSENTDYYVSIGNLQQKPIMRNLGDGFKRTNFQTNVNANISKRIKVGVGIIGRVEETAQAGLPGDDYGFAEQTAFRNLPTLRPYANDNPKYPGISAVDPQYSYGWVGYETSGKYSQIRNAITVNGNLEVQILPGLKARALGSYTFTNTQQDLHEKSPLLYIYDKNTQAYNLAPNLPAARYVERTFSNSKEITTNFQLDYRNSFGDHNLQAVAGVEARSTISPSLYALGSPAANGIAFIPNTPSAITTLTDNLSFLTKRQNYSTKINYDYKGKYIAEFVGRYDGSPSYIDGKRWGFFPGGSVAYRISEEDFWRKSKLLSNINDFKLRASYGVMGQELGGVLDYLAGYNYGNQGVAIVNGQEIITSRIAGLPSVNLTWGRVKALNIGVDVTLLNNRLSGGFEWFERTQTGLAAGRVDVLLPDLVGFSRPNENLNSDIVRGIEGSINWRDKVGEFNYFFGGNFTFSRWITGYRYKQDERWTSEWARYRGGPGNDEGRYRDGTMQLIGIGQFQSWEEIRNYPIDQDHEGNRTIRPGDFKFEDINGDGFINDLDMKIVTYRVNSGTPWINFGFNLGGSYKGFDIRADFVGATGTTYEQQGYMRYFDSNQNVSQYLADNSTWYKDIWDRNSGFNIGKYPLLTRGANNWMTTHWPNSLWQTNLTYVKLRNLEIGYTIPYNVLKRVGVSNFRVYVAGQNVAQISNMPGGLDPEITSNGGNSYPNPRVYTMGVQVKF